MAEKTEPMAQSSHSDGSGSGSSVDLNKQNAFGWSFGDKDRSQTNAGFADRPNDLQDGNELTKSRTHTLLGGKIKLRARDDDDPTDWWFASTAIPLLAATFAPMANMLSIAALVVYWRNKVTTPDVPATKYSLSVGVRDPQWALNFNGASLACGFLGNIFLLCNFTRKIRYIIALPVTILLFYIAAGILCGILAAMNAFDPPKEGEVYSQGYWAAVIAACLYLLNAILLMVNMLGYFLGHYPQHFDLNDEQRNLILQTMIFFIWLAGGAGVFAQLEKDQWAGSYSDALYFCTVTLLTIGFGDFYATSNTGRGLVFPYTVGGTIILGLLVSSLHKFAQELSKEKVVKKHIETRRVNTLRRVVSVQEPLPSALGQISRPLESSQIQHDLDEKAKLERLGNRSIAFDTPPRTETAEDPLPNQFRYKHELRTTGIFGASLERVASLRHRVPALLPSRSQKEILMRSEKDRFDKMRDIQFQAKRFKRWYALTMSIISFGLLWCVGAVVFWQVEQETQGMTYFQGLYFCYVCLLTIGYGDLSPKSNAGKPFFVFWALVAVPIMTILVSDLGDTAIGSFKRKVLEYGDVAFLGKGRGWGLDWFTKRKESFGRRLSMVGISHEKAPKLEQGSAKHKSATYGDEAVDQIDEPKTIEDLVNEDLSETELTKQLAFTMQRVSDDIKHNPDKKYSYEEWVHFTRLVRFSRLDQTVKESKKAAMLLEEDEAVSGLVEWDWLDSNSPMTSEQAEPEWVMDRLLESLLRTFRKDDILRRIATMNEDDDLVQVRDHAVVSAEPRLSSSYRRSGSVAESNARWSKRGEARRRSSTSGREAVTMPAPDSRKRFRPASGFHGRMSRKLKGHGIGFKHKRKTSKNDPT